MNIKRTEQKRIVIIGGGFAGINLAKQLSKQNVQVVILDKHNYHTFQPLLYQVATAGLEPDSIAYPLRKLFQNHPNCIFRWTEVKEVVPDEKKVVTTIGDLEYDYLVLATGSKTNFFGFNGDTMMKMKTIPQALDLRSVILQNFEKALLETDEERRRALMSFVIVGGGPTGVELAGALAEMKRYILPKDYKELDLSLMEIRLYEAAPRLLASMSEISSKKAKNYLEKLGVKVAVNTRVNRYDNNLVEIHEGESIASETVIWTAGVKGATINGIPKEQIVRGNRIKVNDYNQIEGLEDIYAIGDIAYLETEEYPKGIPMLAPAAVQQGQHLAKNFKRLFKGQSLVAFDYKNKGTMATVGRNRAVVELIFARFQGIMAWFVWMFVHILTLIGFRNRLTVFVNWTISYFTYNKALRLIIRPFKK